MKNLNPVCWFDINVSNLENAKLMIYQLSGVNSLLFHLTSKDQMLQALWLKKKS